MPPQLTTEQIQEIILQAEKQQLFKSVEKRQYKLENIKLNGLQTPTEVINTLIKTINARRSDEISVGNNTYRVMCNSGEMSYIADDFIEHGLRNFVGAMTILEHSVVPAAHIEKYKKEEREKLADIPEHVKKSFLKPETDEMIAKKIKDEYVGNLIIGLEKYFEDATKICGSRASSDEKYNAMFNLTNLFDATVSNFMGEFLRKPVEKVGKEISLAASLKLSANPHTDMVITKVDVSRKILAELKDEEPNTNTRSSYLVSDGIEKEINPKDVARKKYTQANWFKELSDKFPWVNSLFATEGAALLKASVPPSVNQTNLFRNVRNEYVFIENSDSSLSKIYETTRSAIISPRAIKNEKERIQITKENLEAIIKTNLKNRFKEFLNNYGDLMIQNPESKKIHFSHVYQTLLSPLFFLLGTNSEHGMLEDKRKAIELINADSDFKLLVVREMMEAATKEWLKEKPIPPKTDREASEQQRRVLSKIDFRVLNTNAPNNSMRRISRPRSSTEVADSRALATQDAYERLDLLKTKFPKQKNNITVIQKYLRASDYGLTALFQPPAVQKSLRELNAAINADTSVSEKTKKAWVDIGINAVALKDRNAEWPWTWARRKLDETPYIGRVVMRPLTAILSSIAFIAKDVIYQGKMGKEDKRATVLAEGKIADSRNIGCKSANDRGGTMILFEEAEALIAMIKKEIAVYLNQDNKADRKAKEQEIKSLLKVLDSVLDNLYHALRATAHGPAAISTINATAALKDNKLGDSFKYSKEQEQQKEMAAKMRYGVLAVFTKEAKKQIDEITKMNERRLGKVRIAGQVDRPTSARKPKPNSTPLFDLSRANSLEQNPNESKKKHHKHPKHRNKGAVSTGSKNPNRHKFS